jgi:hypothetical protein
MKGRYDLDRGLQGSTRHAYSSTFLFMGPLMRWSITWYFIRKSYHTQYFTFISGSERAITMIDHYDKNNSFKGNTHIYLYISSLKYVAWHYFLKFLFNFFFFFYSSRYRNFNCNTRIWIDVHHIFFTGSSSNNCFFVCPSNRPYNLIALSNIIKTLEYNSTLTAFL